MESQSLCVRRTRKTWKLSILMCQGRRKGGSSGEIGRGRQLDPPTNEMAPHMLVQMKSRQS